jgi:hypothetical protein
MVKWIRSFGAQVQDLSAEKSVTIVELDKMHTYIGSTKPFRIWIAVDRDAKRFLHRAKTLECHKKLCSRKGHDRLVEAL